jgi:hypothetical protein
MTPPSVSHMKYISHSNSNLDYSGSHFLETSPVRPRILCSRRSRTCRTWTTFTRGMLDILTIYTHNITIIVFFADSSKIRTHRCFQWSLGEIRSKNSATQPRFFSYWNDVQVFLAYKTWTRIPWVDVFIRFQINQVELIISNLDNVAEYKYGTDAWDESVQNWCFFILNQKKNLL